MKLNLKLTMLIYIQNTRVITFMFDKTLYKHQNYRFNLSSKFDTDFKFGININNKYDDGCFIFSNNRLIYIRNEIYEHPGICGIVNIPLKFMGIIL